MNNYKTCTIEDIKNDAQGNEEKVKFLKELAKRKETNKNGKKNTISFVSLKREYYKAFYKELIPVAIKKETMLDIINAL